MRPSARTVLVLVAALVSLAPSERAYGQYFGRNKIVYEHLRFQVLETGNFDIYYTPDKYPEGAPAIRDVGRMSERWYDRLRDLFNHSFNQRKPLIFYENQTDFHQTNILGGDLGEGTGGVTEGLKNRMIMPLGSSYGATDHVLGHELVHVFQYDIASRLGSQFKGLQAMSQLPLWWVEGMAEYLSIGPTDPHTAMWIRDALIHDYLPTLRDLTRRPNRYFPYRWGEAFWAYVGQSRSDSLIGRIYGRSLVQGMEFAIQEEMDVSMQVLSARWQKAIRSSYEPLLEGRTRPEDAGDRILAPETSGGGTNLAPSISPDGRYVAYLSEQDLFSLELYLADARTGETIRKLTTTAVNRHYAALRMLDTAGSWSPDGDRFAFVIFRNGRNQLAILNVARRSVERRISIPNVEEIVNPTWSPDGERIAFTGVSGGQSDLYVHTLPSESTRKLTDDQHADLQPTWSPDGSELAFVTDRGPGTNLTRLQFGPMQIGLLDVEERSDKDNVRVLELFGPRSNHFNPQFGPDGQDLYFISDRDGFKDVYRYERASSRTFQITRLATGVSGVTSVSPALSVARNSGRMLFSIYEDGDYIIYGRDSSETRGERVEDEARPRYAGRLPAERPAEEVQGEDRDRADASGDPVAPLGLVETYLARPERGLPKTLSARTRPYRPQIQLDYISGYGGVGVGTGGYTGTQLGASGGIFMSHSDMLGNHQISSVLFANGGYRDLGGQVLYMNQSRRFQWGLLAGHVPSVYSNAFVGRADIERDGEVLPNQPFVGQITERQYVQQGALAGAYPFSPNLRIEGQLGYTRIAFERMLTRHFRNPPVRDETELEVPDPLHLGQASTALVNDRSLFGFTSPIQGQRYRLDLTQTVGSLSNFTAQADYRRYAMFRRPFTLAFRGTYYGRYEMGSPDRYHQPFYLGYGTLMRGYGFRTFEPEECDLSQPSCPTFDRLSGDRAVLANLELRFPLFGASGFGLVDFPYLPIELAGFLDGGLAWDPGDDVSLELTRESDERIPVFSTGATARINLMGALIFQVHYVYPFQRPEKGWHWAFTLSPGW